MPYKSSKQRGKFHAMIARGEIDEATVDEWDKASKGKKLPTYAKGSKLGKWGGQACVMMRENFSSDIVSLILNVPRSTATAWRAHRTRGTYK